MESNHPTPTTPGASDPLADVVPFTELPKHHPQFFPTKHSAYWLLRQRDRNGLAAIIHFVGRTPFISRAEFAAWVRSRSSADPRTAAQHAASEKNLSAARANANARRGTAVQS